MSRSTLYGFLSFAVALGAVFAFEYAIAQTVAVTLCGNVGPYAHTHPCPQPSAALITTIPFAFVIAVIAGLITAGTLSPGWVFAVWVALCVPSGVLLALLGHIMPSGKFALYAVGAMLVVMGIGPAFNRTKATDST